MLIIENIQTQSDDNKYVAGVCVCVYDILIEKLDHHGLREVAKDWFISYLKGRWKFLVIENETSTTPETLIVVPQGSVLGPLLFLIYINDLNTCIQFSKTYHFVDDIKILPTADTLKITFLTHLSIFAIYMSPLGSKEPIITKANPNTSK